MADEIKKDEILSEEELDKVAGGTVQQTASDLQFLRDSGAVKELDGHQFGNDAVSNNFDKYSALATKAWGRAGITCTPSADGDNVYKRGDQTISRWQAFKIVAKANNFDFKPSAYNLDPADIL